MTHRVRTLAALLVACLLIAAGCAAPGDVIDKWFGSGPVQKPADLVVFKPIATAKIVWQASVGSSEKRVFSPAINNNVVYAAGGSGQILRLDAATGKVLGRIDSKLSLTGGVGTDGKIVLVGGSKGEVVAFDSNGKELWKSQMTSEVLSGRRLRRAS